MKREDLPDILYDSYERYMGNNLNINTKSDIDIKTGPGNVAGACRNQAGACDLAPVLGRRGAK